MDQLNENGEIMRLQKYMSQAGVCSRRKAEEYITRGLVMVNGEKATLGMSVNPKEDEIIINDKIIEERSKLVYYKLNKPRDIITTCKQDGESSILDVVDIPERVFPIGRLDKETTGLILLTNDWRLSNYLMHPRYEHEKEYAVEVYGRIEDDALENMRKWVMVLGKMTKPAVITRLSSGKFAIVLTEGRNRQIRRMVEAVEHTVKKLKRIRIENIMLGDLEEGEYKTLNTTELQGLFKKLGI
jgi:23S rRNA pseudouridine2605 synthase